MRTHCSSVLQKTGGARVAKRIWGAAFALTIGTNSWYEWFVATGFLIEIKSAIRCIGSFDELIKMSMQCWSLTTEKASSASPEWGAWLCDSASSPWHGSPSSVCCPARTCPKSWSCKQSTAPPLASRPFIAIISMRQKAVHFRIKVIKIMDTG